MSTFNPEVHRRLDSLLAEIGDTDYTKISEFEIILRHVAQAYYTVSCSELRVDPLCCDTVLKIITLQNQEAHLQKLLSDPQILQTAHVNRKYL